MKPEGWQNVVDVIEPILAQSWFDERWLNNELDRLEARSAFSTPGGLAALARYAHHTRAGELLPAHSPNALTLAVVQALENPAGPASAQVLTWLLEQQLMRDPGLLRLLGEDRRPWGAAVIAGAGRSLPPSSWSSPWDPKKKPSAPAALEVPTAPFEERCHAPIVPVPQSPTSERHEREWHQLEWQNTFHLRGRLVPDYGLTPEGVLPLTPPVRLVLEGLKARLVDEGGKVLKALPAIADQELAADLAELKKRAAGLAREIAERLELRMSSAARMSVEHFTEVYAQHGIARQVASGVLFGAYSGGKLRTPFLIDQGAVFSPDLSIGVVHPLELLEGDRALWKMKRPSQPFEQLTRATTSFPSPRSFEQAVRGFAGRSVPSGALLGLEKRGWVRGNVEGGGCYWNTARKAGGVEVVVEFEPGIYVGDPTANPQQRITRVICAAVEEPSPLVMSELVNDLQKALK